VTCAEYATSNNLLDTPGWKRFKRYAKNQKMMQRLINQAKLRSYQREPFWKICVLVPQTHGQAVELDKKNGNKLWQDAEATEMRQLMEYQTFIDKEKGCVALLRYKKIRCHIVYDVKHFGCHKACLVAGGNLTDPNTECVSSGVVSLQGIKLIDFLAELNKLELWGADVGNAYLEANTKAKVNIGSKHWGYQNIWHLLKPLLFYSGSTIDLLDTTPRKPNNEQLEIKQCNSCCSHWMNTKIGANEHAAIGEWRYNLDRCKRTVGCRVTSNECSHHRKSRKFRDSFPPYGKCRNSCSIQCIATILPPAKRPFKIALFQVLDCLVTQHIRFGTSVSKHTIQNCLEYC
jgi:hypothetical protein